MKLTEVYSSSGGFLKADDVTQPITGTIESAEMVTKDYGDGKGPKSQIVLSFVGKDKKLGLNFTNANKIAELVGSDDTDAWIGHYSVSFREMHAQAERLLEFAAGKPRRKRAKS